MLVLNAFMAPALGQACRLDLFAKEAVLRLSNELPKNSYSVRVIMSLERFHQDGDRQAMMVGDPVVRMGVASKAAESQFRQY